MQSPSQRFHTQLFKFEHTLRTQWSLESPATPEQLCNYEDNWLSSFQNKYLGATEQELMRVIAHSSCVIVSDFHPLKRSRQDFSTIIELMNISTPTIAVLELLNSDVSIKSGSRYQDIKLENGWPLHQSYPQLFDNDLQAKYDIVGAWIDGSPSERDAYAASVAANLNESQPNSKLAFHFGDWHLAKQHLPQELEQRDISATAVHLSPSPLWDKVNKRDFDEVIRLSDSEWAWMRTPPLAHAAAFLLDFGACDSEEYSEELSFLIEIAATNLARSLDVEQPQSAFEVMQADEWHNFYDSLDTESQQSFNACPEYAVFHPRLARMWIPSEVDANQIIQGAAHLLYCQQYATGNAFIDAFRSALLRNLCSITINPFYKLPDNCYNSENQWVERGAFKLAKDISCHEHTSIQNILRSLKHVELRDYELQSLRDTIGVA